MKHFNIAIDGPAGAGKSTIAKEVARRLGFVYVDTGAMYRTMALHFIRSGIDPKDEQAVAASCRDVDVSLRYENGVQQVLLGGENVTGLIRTEEVGNMASATSVYKPVREKLVQLQQALARRENVVMDGRDIGTCVLPDAPAKIYLTASSAGGTPLQGTGGKGHGVRSGGDRAGHHRPGLPGYEPGELPSAPG